MCVAFDDLFDEFARDHESDAALARIGTFHRVQVAEARGAAEVPALAHAFDRIIGERVNAPPVRDLALFNLAIDSKLRGCDVVAVRVDDVAPNGYTLDRATVRQKKTGRPAGSS